MRRWSFAAICLSALGTSAFSTSNANADIVTSVSDLRGISKVVTFDDFAGSLQPITPAISRQVGGSVGEDILASANSFGGFVGQPEPFQLGSNGVWDAVTKGPYVGTNASSVSITFKFNGGPVRGVGAFLNYGPGAGPNPLMEALDASGRVLESYDLAVLAPIVTPGAINDGAFRGIIRSQPDIAAFRVSNSFFVLDDLRFVRPVPEPASWMLVLGGTFMLRLSHRRLKYGSHYSFEMT